ncbi:MAG: ligase-associated DNA damage response endonuclease PdeM [Paracoccaceae bacterium]
MGEARITLAGATLKARPSGALHWPSERLLAVGDLHLGRAVAVARRGGAFLPPYADLDTLTRLAAEVDALDPATLLLLGDSFDDAASADTAAARLAGRIGALAAGRRLVWVAGNHDPRPVAGLPGDWRAAFTAGSVTFRHIAEDARPGPGAAEVSAHYHPKARLLCRGTAIGRRCFLADEARLILPAFGTYTGGLDARDAAFDAILGPRARALMLGHRVVAVARARLA